MHGTSQGAFAAIFTAQCLPNPAGFPPGEVSLGGSAFPEKGRASPGKLRERPGPGWGEGKGQGRPRPCFPAPTDRGRVPRVRAGPGSGSEVCGTWTGLSVPPASASQRRDRGMEIFVTAAARLWALSLPLSIASAGARGPCGLEVPPLPWPLSPVALPGNPHWETAPKAPGQSPSGSCQCNRNCAGLGGGESLPRPP